MTLENKRMVFYPQHFNSHAHVERDARLKGIEIPKVISTHTLTWSVTFDNDNNANYLKISTHTLTWSVTLLMLLSLQYSAISTHTLTWSVTSEMFLTPLNF